MVLLLFSLQPVSGRLGSGAILGFLWELSFSLNQIPSSKSLLLETPPSEPGILARGHIQGSQASVVQTETAWLSDENEILDLPGLRRQATRVDRPRFGTLWSTEVGWARSRRMNFSTWCEYLMTYNQLSSLGQDYLGFMWKKFNSNKCTQNIHTYTHK